MPCLPLFLQAILVGPEKVALVEPEVPVSFKAGHEVEMVRDIQPLIWRFMM